MAKNNVTEITNRADDFAQWYTDIVKKAELVDYSSVRGCTIFKPNGYAIWENIQKIVDTKFKEHGHQNVYLPMFIPENLLQKEADHVEGFAPEVARVTEVGSEKLDEALVVRPTSEVLFCELFKSSIQSYRDLPKVYNQWCSVVRWEKTTRPFLRTSEFLWQEGHAIHETSQESHDHTLTMLNVYADFFENYLAIPVTRGQKTEKEKFAGAESTYTIEALMHDGKALQCGTSHYFGNGFAEAFDIEYTSRENKVTTPFQSSYGISTRSIGGIIMVHGDDNGLVLPPRIAPTQVVVIPVMQNKEGVLEKATEMYESIKEVATVILDDSDKKPGWKFSEYEMKGIPVRVEVGPRDIQENTCVLARRDTNEKITISIDDLNIEIPKLLEDIHTNMFNKALAHREANINEAFNMDEFKNVVDNNIGYIKTMWCGDLECEEKIKEDIGVSSRCMPFNEEKNGDVCVCCGKPANKLVYWGKAY